MFHLLIIGAHHEGCACVTTRDLESVPPGSLVWKASDFCLAVQDKLTLSEKRLVSCPTVQDKLTLSEKRLVSCPTVQDKLTLSERRLVSCPTVQDKLTAIQ